MNRKAILIGVILIGILVFSAPAVAGGGYVYLRFDGEDNYAEYTNAAEVGNVTRPATIQVEMAVPDWNDLITKSEAGTRQVLYQGVTTNLHGAAASFEDDMGQPGLVDGDAYFVGYFRSGFMHQERCYFRVDDIRDAVNSSNEPFMLTLTYEDVNSGWMSLWVDNTEITRRYETRSATNNQNLEDFMVIGMDQDKSTGPLEFDLTEFRIWDKVFTLTDVNNTYDTELTGTETDLVLLYHVDEGTGTALEDKVNTNDATISGATWGSTVIPVSIEIKETDETPASPATYATNNEYNFTATVCHSTNISDLDTITYTFDGSDYTPTEIGINTTCSQYYWNTTELAAGSYDWEWFAKTGGENHTASGTYTINQATPSLSLSASPSWNETWPIETNISGSGCPSQLTCNLYRNDGAVSNPDVQNLAAGSYVYVYNTSGNENYTTASETETLTINKATNNTVTVSIDPSTSVAYGTETTVTCSDVGGATLTLTRNGVGVTSPSTAVLSTGTYVFNCSATGHENYTDTYETETLTVREGGVGCTNNTTFTFSTTINITDATTIIDFQDQIDLGNIRSDVQDVGISNGSVSVIGSEQYASFNTSGLIGEDVTIYWGNYVISGEHSTGSATPTPTNNITSYSEINNYIRLTFRDEITLEQRLAPNTNTTLNLYCEGGQRGIVLEDGSNVTSLVVPTYQSRWTKARAAVEYSPTEIYTRTILITSGISERTMWLVDAESYQMAQVVNELNDLSGKFKTGETWLEVKKWSGDELRTVYQEYFDASRYAYFFGHVGSEYQYYVHGKTETRNLGWVVVDTSNLHKTITLAVVVNFDNVEYLGNVRFATYYNETTGVITLVYSDEYNKTTEVNMSIWNTTGTRNEKDSLLYFASATNITNDTSLIVFQYLVPNRNATYMLYGAANHLEAIGPLSFSTLFGGLATAALTGISQVYLTLSALVATFSVTFSLSWKNVAFGSVVGAVLLGMFASIGFLNIPTALVAVILMGSIVWMLGREVHKP